MKAHAIENHGSEILLRLAPFYVWAYNGAMEIVNFQQNQYDRIGASGDCPHCRGRSFFRPLHPAYTEQPSGSSYAKVVNAAQCEACKGFILVLGRRLGAQSPSELVALYPLGKPSDTVNSDVPPGVAEDFREALRCHWIEAYKACVVMCRRAVQRSVLEHKAKDGKLVDQIDDLFTKGKITEPLREFAHEVRLTGNDGAHPDKDGLVDVTEKDASDIVEFTREYLHHVYVMPAKLKARRPAAASVAKPSV